MKKYLLAIADYKDYRQDMFVRIHSVRNKAYCDHHGFEYLEITNLNDIPEHCKQKHIFFLRHYYIKHLIDSGFLKDGDIIASIDADIIIVNGRYPFVPPEGKSFAYAIDSCNTHCMGAFSLRLSEWGKQLNANMLDEERHQKFQDKPFWKIFNDQACWYSLAGIKDSFADPRQIGWNSVPHLGWHSTTDNDPKYTLEELYQNVEILPVEWNVTSWFDQNVYFRFPTKTANREDVIFRHFAGGGYWESEEWNKIKLF